MRIAALLAMITLGDEARVGDRTFALAAGFAVERVAGPPLVDRPVVADFDERGRLYVCESSGSNDPVAKQLAERPHRVLRLEDVDGDGVYDRRTVFADKMMFPAGAMWRGGSLYVAAPPSIWKLTDTDDDGVADVRVEWFAGKTLTGCANDLHGPYNGPDGRIYWTKGAFAPQTYDRPGRAPLATRAAHILRARPDGTDIEPVLTGGMDNPVEVAFTAGGERIVDSTFVQHPEGARRDGLIHAIYGGLYGKAHDVIDDQIHTSAGVMPTMLHLGAAAPSGLMCYESRIFGNEYKGNLFGALFNMQKIARVILKPEGATFSAVAEDLIACDDRDFHPTDVLEDADGSLLVVDTGGWYKLCCPTSQIAKPDVLGAVYRVRKLGAPRVDDPRGRELDWAAPPDVLASRLVDEPRPAVRRRAVEALSGLGAAAVPSLAALIRGSADPDARRDATWAAGRIDDPSARAAVRIGLTDADETVRQAAAHLVALNRDRGAVPSLLKLVAAGPAQVRRVAAEALGRIGDPAAVPALLAALGDDVDQTLEHSLTYALIEIGDPPATRYGLGLGGRARRASLMALEQMVGGDPPAEAVLGGLEADDRRTAEACAWILARHPAWGPGLAAVLGRRLDGPSPGAAEAALIGRFADIAEVGALIGARLNGASTPAATRRACLDAVRLARPRRAPARWVDGLVSALGSGDPSIVGAAALAARALGGVESGADRLATALIAVGDDPAAAGATRLVALAAAPGGRIAVAAPTFAYLSTQIRPDRPAATRSAATAVLARSSLGRDQLLSLAEALADAGPVELPRLLDAFEPSRDAEVGRRLVEAIGRSPALASLRVETLRPRIDPFGAPIRARAEAIYRAIDADLDDRGPRLDALLAATAGGDARRGQALFNGPKAACATCHAVGYLGGRLGPDLSAIGRIRADRDLLESIVYPSASLARGYEPVVVTTRGGKVVAGIPRADTANELVLAINAAEETRIDRADVEEVRPGTVSVMPAGLDKQLSTAELADLLAFLRSRR